jgi:hypothetical protein
MLPMLVVKKKINTIKQHGKGDNVCQTPLGITQLEKRYLKHFRHQFTS